MRTTLLEIYGPLCRGSAWRAAGEKTFRTDAWRRFGLQTAIGMPLTAGAATRTEPGGIAVGLSGISDWGASQPFIDVMRQSP